MISRKRDPEGNSIGGANANPVLDTRRYEVEFGDGEITELNTNMIAESMYAQVYSEGNYTFMIDCMVDYRRNKNALTIKFQKIVVKGRPSIQRSTVGWFVCIKRKDVSTSREKLSYMKECYPVETTEYELAQGIDHGPVYN